MRDEVRASAAAHRDLGPGYDTAVAEGLVERIGEEIDRRVDARLYGAAVYQNPPRRPRREPAPGRMGFGAVVLALGSMGLAIGGTVAVLHPGDSPPGQVTGGQAVLTALLWIVIGVINVAYARYRQLSAWSLPPPGYAVSRSGNPCVGDGVRWRRCGREVPSRSGALSPASLAGPIRTRFTYKFELS